MKKSDASIKIKWRSCIVCAMQNNINQMRNLLESNSDIFYYVDKTGCNILHILAGTTEKVSHEAYRELIISAVIIGQATDDILDHLFFQCNNNGYTPLQLAISTNNTDRLNWLMDFYKTALGSAGCKYDQQTVKFKISKLIYEPNKAGESALDIAKKSVNKDSVRLFSMTDDSSYSSSSRLLRTPSQHSSTSVISRDNSFDDIVSVKKSSFSEYVKDSSSRQQNSTTDNNTKNQRGCMIS